jgi:hypothetical protein
MGSGSISGATFTLALYSDNAGAPGTSLLPFSGNNQPVAAGQYTYTLSSPYTLAAGTQYWVVAQTPGGVGNINSFFRWNTTLSNVSTGDPGWSIGRLATHASFLPPVTTLPWQQSSTSSAMLSGTEHDHAGLHGFVEHRLFHVVNAPTTLIFLVGPPMSHHLLVV